MVSSMLENKIRIALNIIFFCNNKGRCHEDGNSCNKGKCPIYPCPGNEMRLRSLLFLKNIANSHKKVFINCLIKFNKILFEKSCSLSSGRVSQHNRDNWIYNVDWSKDK